MSKNELVAEYRRERRRTLQAIRRMEKRGFIVPESVIPKKPKKITAGSVRRMKKLTADYLYKKSKYVDYETGELMSGDAARKILRKRAAKKAAERRAERRAAEYLEKMPGVEYSVGGFDFDSFYSEGAAAESEEYEMFPDEAEMVIKNFRRECIARFPVYAGPILERWLSEMEAKYSKQDVAKMLQEAAYNGIIVDYQVAYDEELLLARIAEFMEYLPGMSEGVKNDIMEIIEMESMWEMNDSEN